MSGLYVHIPYCKQACHYCDFHFSVSQGTREHMAKALIRELELRQDYLPDKQLETVYFGGGTPSILPEEELTDLFESIRRLFVVAENAEITLEANPDDLTDQKLELLQSLGVNRLSIGIQSFQEEDLRFMNRSHSVQEAKESILRARRHGFRDLTIDLIYGSPSTPDEAWLKNLEIAASLELPHLSAYSLTVEPRTAFARFVRGRRIPSPDEDQSARQFFQLMEWAAACGYEHYEISNFALPGRHSRHNTAYWRGVPYLGIGPSAHSFNGDSRQWNIRNNPEFIRTVMQGDLPFEKEELTMPQQYNEYVLTSLRTMWGTDEQKILQRFGEQVAVHFRSRMEMMSGKEWTENKNGIWVLTTAGKLMADYIASEAFYP